MFVAGIDYSTRAVDVVLVHLDDLEPPRWSRFLLDGNDAFDRSRSVYEAMPLRGSTFWDAVLAVGIEHPAGRFGVGDMLRVQGAVLGCIPTQMLVEPWPPAKWRSAVGLKGNASKAEIAARSCEIATGVRAVSDWVLWPADWPQDAHDAHLIALATRQAITRENAA